MASINRYQTINDIPASKGKDVLLKMLASGDYNHYESGENRQN